MNKKSEVWPYLMNVLDLVVIDHHFHAHLAPCRHTNDVADVPFLCVFYNLIQLLVPIAERSDTSPGLIESLKPKRSLPCENAAKVSSVPASLSFLEIGGAAQHEKALRHCLAVDLFIAKQCKQLPQVVDGVTSQHFLGDRNVFACSFGGARAECVVFYLSRPGHIGNTIKSL